MGLLTSNATQSHEISLPMLGTILSVCLVFYVAVYIIYQRYFHPLAKFPGPFLASLTDLWQASEFLHLKQPYNLTALHEKYGQFVRYGPDKISTTAEDAIPVLYQKGGRMYPKTEFYDAYGSSHPNVFGIRDESVCTWTVTLLRMPLTPCLRYILFDGGTCLTVSPSLP